MNNDWSDFAEGDSGVPMIAYSYDRLEQTEAPAELSTVQMDTNRFVGEIYAIAAEKSNPAEARVAAYALVWRISIDRMKCNDPSLNDAIND